MRFNFNACPDCGEPYGSYGLPRFERHSRVYDNQGDIVTSMIRAVCDKCGWETKSHYNVEECAKEWNRTNIYEEDNVEDFDCRKEARHLASKVMTEIHKRDKTGELLYSFVRYLRGTSRLYAYRGNLKDEYDFEIVPADEYKKLKGEQ